MASRVDPRPGDLVVVPVSEGMGYLAHIWSSALESLILVATYNSPWRGEAVADGPPILLGLVTIEAVRRGRWPVIGWAAPPPAGAFPVYRMLYGGVPHVVTILADDGPRRPVSNDEYAQLPDYTYDTPESLEWVLRSRLGLQDWGPLGDTGDLIPRPNAIEDVWFRD